MSSEVRVRPAQAEVTNEPVGVLVASGLASTAAVAMFDPECGVGGLLHWVVPACPPKDPHDFGPALAAESGIPWLLNELELRGAKRENLRAALAGAASLQGDSELDLGARNREAGRRLLAAHGVTLEAEATGGTVIRELRLDLMNGRFDINPKEGATQ